MYTYEIDSIFKNNNYHISNTVYVDITRNSPQVDHVKYSPYGNYFELWTNDGYYTKFTVYLEEKMIKRIREYFTYRKNLKELKKYAVASVVDYVKGKEDYLNGIRKILLSLKEVESVEEIQKMFMHELAEIVHNANEKDESDINTESDEVSEEQK